MIGTLGRKIIFDTNDERILTFNGMTREVTGRWTEHEVLGSKPKPEFLGAGNQSITIPIHLSANLGVRPRSVLEAIAAMVESGAAEVFVIGSRPVSPNPFRIMASSETWDTLYSGGELVKASLSITLGEYT